MRSALPPAAVSTPISSSVTENTATIDRARNFALAPGIPPPPTQINASPTLPLRYGAPKQPVWYPWHQRNSFCCLRKCRLGRH